MGALERIKSALHPQSGETPFCPAKLDAYLTRVNATGDAEYLRLGRASLKYFGCDCPFGPKSRLFGPKTCGNIVAAEIQTDTQV